MKIGILAVQGAVKEHGHILSKISSDIDVIEVKTPEVLKRLDGLIIPGGESSTISRLIDSFCLRKTILERAKEGMNIMGTCAGSILMAKEGDMSVDRTDTVLLGLMDMTVTRNHFGRQKESFESHLYIEKIADDYPGVFIRAPVIKEVKRNCRVLSTLDGYIVGAEQDDLMALAFHPELTDDTRVHEYFIDKINRSLYRSSKNS